VVYEFTDELLYTECELFEYVDKFVSSKDPMVLSVSGEKGVFFESSFECDEFDLSQLKLVIDTEVGISEYFYGDMVSKVLYNGEELDNIGGSTDGKYFEVGSNIFE
jgi:hypothetical protein